jgi:hypothetical protein
LHVEWQQYKPLVLELAASRPAFENLLATITDDLDEGKKKDVSYLSASMIYLLYIMQHILYVTDYLWMDSKYIKKLCIIVKIHGIH